MAVISVSGFSFNIDENYTRSFLQESPSEVGFGTEYPYTRKYEFQDVDTVIRGRSEVGYASSVSASLIGPIFTNVAFVGIASTGGGVVRPTNGLMYPRRDC